MARGKKKEELSLEEKLERALVPTGEQPYQVPGNWCWVKLDFLVNIATGKKDANFASEDGEYLFFTCAGEPIRCNGYSFDRESLIMAGNGANVGNVFYYDGKFEAYQRTYVLQAFSENINLRYLYYQLQGFWKEYNKDKQYGSATNYIKMGNFLNYNVPVAPLYEQQRIVDRIERMFAQLDEVEEKLKSILEGINTRKISILHKAFQGELTTHWRSNHGIDIDTWKEKQLNEVCRSIFDGDHMPPPKTESGVHFLVISDVNTGFLLFENTRYVSQEYYDNLTVTRKPEKGDILYTLVGSYGIPIVVDTDIPFCFQRHIGLLKPDKIDTYFLWYQMQSHEFYNKATDIANGTAQLTVPIKGLRKLKVRCPLESEQKAIVEILNDLFAKDHRMKQIVESVLHSMDLLKKSILSKAFRGQLGTNHPEEESAMELLKSILMEPLP